MPIEPTYTLPVAEQLDQTKPSWYFALLAPAQHPAPPYAWIDPTYMYQFPQALSECVEDMVKPFENDEIDIVASIDAMGFVLGGAIAYRMKKGMFSLRKGGKLAVFADSIKYADYQGEGKSLEIRQNPFEPGMRVLLVDQWIETGGSMEAAAQLIESKGGIVAGVTVICCESSPGGKRLKDKYKLYHSTPPHLQEMLDNHDWAYYPAVKDYYLIKDKGQGH